MIKKPHTSKTLPQQNRSNIEKITRAIKYRVLIKRNFLAFIILVSVFVLSIGLLIWWLFIGQHHQTTEDAYVDGNIIAVSSQIPGTIIKIHGDTTDFIEAKQPLVTLDPLDTQLAFEKAQTELAKTIRSVRVQFASSDQYAANLEQKQAELNSASTQYQHRLQLSKTGALSLEALEQAEQIFNSAQAAVNAAQKQLIAGQAMIDQTTIATHPSVLNAITQVKSAYINQKRTHIHAPFSGMITKRSAQIGQHIAMGATLMSIVPLDQLWVNANFKESQLNKIKIGQPVKLKADLYGRRVQYHGTVLGVDAGTGSAFALLPAQNATGNWIKVTQRIPVRIALNTEEIKAFPLRIGLSMKVTIDTRNYEQAPSINQINHSQQSYTTDTFTHDMTQIDAIILQIIQQNTLSN